MKVVFEKDGKKGETFTITDSSSLKNGRGIFAGSNIKSFSSDLSSLTNGYQMFVDCSYLTTFSSDLSSLTNADYMFYNCTSLTSFDSDLSKVADGRYMFYNCYNLTPEFYDDLSKLKNADYMFYNCFQDDAVSMTLSLSSTSFSNVVHANHMAAAGGWPFFNFSFDLSSLQDGAHMFSECTNLQKIRTYTSNGNLELISYGNLTNGSYMFNGCTALMQSYTKKGDGEEDVITNYIDMSLYKLKDGSYMFNNCSNVVFSGGSSLEELINGDHMFANCDGRGKWSDILSKNDYRTYNLSNLVNGNYMFYNTPIEIIHFTSLEKLKCGYNMFYGSQLTQGSVERLKLALPDIRGKNKENDEDWKYTIEGQTYTIEGQTYTIDKDYRGVISIQVGKDSSQDYYTDATVQFCGQMADIKGWTVHLYNHDNTKHRIFSP